MIVFHTNMDHIELKHDWKPRADQLQGTVAEQLIEACGRICYDSFGAGRNSVEYHQHIREVKHLSVLEHFNFCIPFSAFPLFGAELYQRFLNKIGLWVEFNGQYPMICLNLRTAYEWPKDCELYPIINRYGYSYAPSYFIETTYPIHIPIIKRDQKECFWVSILMTGSRGFSHEQVRHGDRTAISQRSTRYCDEGGARFYDHPLLTEILREEEDKVEVERMWDIISQTDVSRKIYAEVMLYLQPRLNKKGLSRVDALKQARGAARQYLPNALETEMIFSASLAQWEWMIKQRANPAADAEIRKIYEEKVVPVIESLK